MIKLRDRRIFFSMLIVVLLASLGLAVPQAKAEPAAQESNPEQTAGIDNATCLSCHANPGQQTVLPSGETLFVTVDPNVYDTSVHGEQGYACVQCHTNITGYPHPPIEANSLRVYTVEKHTLCAQCHQDKFEETQDSVHARAQEAGNQNAAVCTDCHGAHNVKRVEELPLSAVPHTCERCHSQIFNLYQNSVHGAALLGEGNPDVPSCTDCHGVHEIHGPSDSPFRLYSPDICAECHANEELMARYGVNTDVFDTYLSDFHGTTVELFRAFAPGQETNKPVCIDCHGVHNILQVNDPNSAVIKENILVTCQRCHPDATTNFPDAWLSHYRPSPDHSPVVYYVQSFYKIFIPTVLGGMALFVLSDLGRRVFRRREDRHG